MNSDKISKGFLHDKEHNIWALLLNYCLKCGDTKLKHTRHHSIPKRENPIGNVTVPICEKCHRKMNDEDKFLMIVFLGMLKNILYGAIRVIEKWENNRKRK